MSEQLPLPFDGATDLTPPFKFGGETYIPHLDGDRLDTQLGRVINLMLTPPGRYRTLSEIEAELVEKFSGNFPQASISARLRDARKMGYRVERVRKGDPKTGLFEYALFRPEASPGE